MILWTSLLGSTSFDTPSQTSLNEALDTVLLSSTGASQYVGILQIIKRRQLQAAKDTHELVIISQITLETDNYPAFLGNATGLYHNTTEEIVTSVSSGVLSSLFQQFSRVNGAVNSTSAIFTQVQFEDLTVTGPTTISSNGAATFALTSTALGGIITGGIIFLALLLLVLYIAYKRCYKQEESKSRGSSFSKGDFDGLEQESSLDSEFFRIDIPPDDASSADGIYRPFAGFLDPGLIKIFVEDIYEEDQDDSTLTL